MPSLQTLVENGEMLLSDGRRIVPATHHLATSGAPNVIISHPDFRMIVLANRPGFPFLGNDFFGSLGNFSHTVIVFTTSFPRNYFACISQSVSQFMQFQLTHFISKMR